MLTGIYGEPLETVRAWLEASAAFATFSPALSVHAYFRIGSDLPPEVGDAWAVLLYPDDGHSIILQPGLDVSRTIEVTFTRVVSGITKTAVEDLINDAGAIVADLIAASEAACILTAIKLHKIGVDESTESPMIGATFRLPLDIGGR
jgi:hypothetical protein